MSTQKRFSKRFEIEAEIIAYKRKMKDKLVKAEAIEVKMRELYDKANNPANTKGEQEYFRDQGNFEKKKANALRRGAFLIEHNRLPQLKEALSEFATQPMPFCGSDESVVLK
jgi:hypothetical protein